MSTDAPSTPDDEIRELVERLSRRDRTTGRRSIERAAIMAEGSRSSEILELLERAGWQPEALPDEAAHRDASGLHGRRSETERGRTRPAVPRRFISPPDA